MFEGIRCPLNAKDLHVFPDSFLCETLKACGWRSPRVPEELGKKIQELLCPLKFKRNKACEGSAWHYLQLVPGRTFVKASTKNQRVQAEEGRGSAR